jgi:CubicO group peptidase (beta-lactamase class C family)
MRPMSTPGAGEAARTGTAASVLHPDASTGTEWSMYTKWARSSLRWLAISLLILWPVSHAAVPVRAASPAPGVDIGRIDAFVQAEQHANLLPGVALALVHNDQIVHLRGFGHAGPDGRPVTPQTPFMLGSVSKSFTALALMQLVEAGKIALDAPVTRYLPWFRLADAQDSARITLRELLAHTSGIPDQAGLMGNTLTTLRTRTLEQSVRGFRTVSPDHPAGAAYEYSDAGYDVLGLIVQTVSGEPFGSYLQRHIFAPLGMKQSFTAEREARAHGLAHGYTSLFGLPVPSDESLLPSNLPSGYVIASAEDLAHFLIAQMNGGQYDHARVLSSAGVAAMHTPQAAGGHYGMGWFRGQINGAPTISHDGNTFRSHAYLVIEPRSGWGAVVLVNLQSALASPAIDHLQDGVASLLGGQEPPMQTLTMPMLSLLIDGVLALILALAVWPLLRLPRWYRRHAQRPRLPVRTGVRLAAELGIPAAIVLGAPALIGLPWGDILFVMPDFGLWFLALLCLVFATGCARGVVVLKPNLEVAVRRRRRATPSEWDSLTV